MVLYDLTKTAAATSLRPIRPPSDFELFAITVGLLMVENRGFSELTTGPVELTNRNRRRVAELLEERAPSLARELGGPALLRARLKQLVGLQIYREFQ
ncbi:MAG: hypothetical protein IPM64_07925 [Phycisphaerales bacterium]|nr:hypothetical protein [Phycisphaerales bacterium]